MKSEMGYKFKGSGHEVPEEKRKYEQPPQKLREAFEKWLGGLPDRDELDITQDVIGKLAISALSGLECSVNEANSLLIHFSGHERITDAGIFLSVVYAKAHEKEIVFDIDIGKPIDSLGYRLPKDKILLLKAPTQRLGEKAKGVVVNMSNSENLESDGLTINYGKAIIHSLYSDFPGINYGESDYFGGGCTSFVINLGKAGERFGGGAQLGINYGTVGDNAGAELQGGEHMLINCGKAGKNFGDSATGIIITFTEPESYGKLDDSQLVLYPDDCKKIAKLRHLLYDLKAQLEKGRNDYKAAIRVCRRLNLDKLENKIERILRDAGKLRIQERED